MRFRRLGLALAVVAAIWSAARVYAGVFYPTDILAGAAVGAAMAILARWLMHLLEPTPTALLRAIRAVNLA